MSFSSRSADAPQSSRLPRSVGSLLGVLLVSAVVSSCGGDGGSGSDGDDGLHPRSLLTEELVKEVFPVGAAELSFREGAGAKYHPNWVAEWPVPNVDEVNAASAAKMQAYMKAKMAGEEVGRMPIPHVQNMVRLTMVGTSFPSTDAAKARFDGLVKFIEKGISREVEVQGKTHKVKFSASYEHSVEGVGDQAAWSSKLHQLSFVAAKRIFHLIVDLGWARRSAAGYPSLALLHDHPELLTDYLQSLGPPLARRDGQALLRIPR